jgi:predicted TIM-barrel fold metal-dependent hydrolase
MTFPMDDAADVRRFWQRLGVPGVIDVHTHFLPERLEARVWAHLDDAGPKIGKGWGIHYRGSEEQRLEFLRAAGVVRFPTLPYAHKPGMAVGLNEFARDFAARVPGSLWSGTFYPEPGALEYVTELIEAGLEIVKIHVQVGEFALDDPLLRPVWGALADARVPVLIHAGGAPVPGTFTGAAGFERLLEQHPALVTIAAHMGEPDFADTIRVAERFEHVYLDTTLVLTDFTATEARLDAGLIDRIGQLQHRVLFGTDFPIIPHAYAHQLEALERGGFGDQWLRDVVWNNAVRLFGLSRRTPSG